MTGIGRIRRAANELVEMANDYPNQETQAALLEAAAILFRHVAVCLDSEAQFLLESREVSA